MAIIKKYIPLIFFLLIFLPFSYAVSFTTEVTPIKDRIQIDEFAKFKLTIKNTLSQKDEYRIYTIDFPIWDVRTEPIVNPITLELEPKEEGSVELIADPLKVKDIGTDAVNVNVRSKVTDEVVTVNLKVTVTSTDRLVEGYIPTVLTSIDIPDAVDPRKEIPIKIVLNNQNVLDYPELLIRIDSNLIKDTITTKLGPKEEKTLELAKNIDALTKPQKDNIVIAIFKDGKSIINPVIKPIEVIAYSTQELVSEEKKFLRTKNSYRLVSNNNDYKNALKVETSLFESIFSSTSPKANIVRENGKRYFIWDAKLENNAMGVSVSRNFIPLFVVLMLLVAVVMIYYRLRSPLLITKEANSIVRSEGGISEMTIVLRIKNRSQSKTKGIEITDAIPALVSVGSDVPIGSLQPNKVLVHEKHGTTIVKWSIDNLDVSEERVLSYKIKSKLLILGSITLPVTKGVFWYNNKLFTCTSNILNVEN
ncbi:hypothetical protein HYX01_01495 [Candidatus Woesearchaeota archaeon]|nr:hypothetical protein [Candidatus Woesearchaeota archaeon]